MGLIQTARENQDPFTSVRLRGDAGTGLNPDQNKGQIIQKAQADLRQRQADRISGAPAPPPPTRPPPQGINMNMGAYGYGELPPPLWAREPLAAPAPRTKAMDEFEQSHQQSGFNLGSAYDEIQKGKADIANYKEQSLFNNNATAWAKKNPTQARILFENTSGAGGSSGSGGTGAMRPGGAKATAAPLSSYKAGPEALKAYGSGPNGSAFFGMFGMPGAYDTTAVPEDNYTIYQEGASFAAERARQAALQKEYNEEESRWRAKVKTAPGQQPMKKRELPNQPTIKTLEGENTISSLPKDYSQVYGLGPGRRPLATTNLGLGNYRV